MILGYLSIGSTVLIVLVLLLTRTSKLWPFYIGAYVVGGILLLSTTLASSQLVGTDINVEYYYASQALQHGWNISLPHSFNSSMVVTILAPLLSGYTESGLIWVFKIVYPLLFALVPVFLLYIYSRFMPIKFAFLSAFFFILVPTFFLEMPQISRQMIAELIVVGMLALLVSKLDHKWKMLGLLIGSFAVVVSHYSIATFWFVFLFSTMIGYWLYNEKPWRALDVGFILIASIALFYGYSHWVANGWQIEDIGNAVQGLTMASGPDSKSSYNLLPAALTLILSYGIYRLIKSKDISKLYKVWIATASLLLIAGVVYPAISNTINFSRYYHLMLIILAPAVVYSFERNTLKITTVLTLIVFLFSSGLIFNLFKIDNIANNQIPYSIALENRRLDAGNYLTSDDDKVAKWAYDNHIQKPTGDLGSMAALEHYYSIYELKPFYGFSPGDYILLRCWNTEQKTYSVTNGPGLRKQIRFPENLDVDLVYKSGGSLLVRVK
jgi:uncharacterized membrane protein